MRTVTKASDLVTTKEATVNGFSWQANEKANRTKAFFSNANYFIKAANQIKSIEDIRRDKIITDVVIASCMLSKKSLSHLTREAQDEIITNLIEFEKLQDPEYVNSLVRKYFLTSGDSLGGTMRNIVGQSAQEKLTEAIVTRLGQIGIRPSRLFNTSNKTVTICWNDRRVIFDKKPQFIGKSVDIIVVKGTSAATGNLENPEDYLCCGELKGGIDPAGADEHWKTAKTALERIAVSFENQGINMPKFIFLGSAIETAMSTEIFSLLQSGWLSGAANINYIDQFNEVIDIIIS
ncbi:AvaI/BsoBI family type II restriction endonuclease [Photorhabdus sp. CRCIA-P01]|uniref:AvaI/BsoBI family type II restriction endonuclease n=1 Tax=Photorhabdus sp. CRCIA-P01 TaxID=2019570 RepID=UPI000E5A0284|nr:AvaI/BsoBI family type II restriction endonuclease [Photorhabdus sp. CRCIA-P01]